MRRSQNDLFCDHGRGTHSSGTGRTVDGMVPPPLQTKHGGLRTGRLRWDPTAPMGCNQVVKPKPAKSRVTDCCPHWRWVTSAGY